MDKIKKRLAEINTSLELTDYYSEGISPEEFIEDLITSIYHDEIIYYDEAIRYLAIHDQSLTQSTELYIGLGGTLDSLNSEALATVLYRSNQMGEFNRISEDIEEAFND